MGERERVLRQGSGLRHTVRWQITGTSSRTPSSSREGSVSTVIQQSQCLAEGSCKAYRSLANSQNLQQKTEQPAAAGERRPGERGRVLCGGASEEPERGSENVSSVSARALGVPVAG